MGLASFFMAYSSSTNPFFMVDKHKRQFGDAGAFFRHNLSQIVALFGFYVIFTLADTVYTKYEMPQLKPLTNSPSSHH